MHKIRSIFVSVWSASTKEESQLDPALAVSECAVPVSCFCHTVKMNSVDFKLLTYLSVTLKKSMQSTSHFGRMYYVASTYAEKLNNNEFKVLFHHHFDLVTLTCGSSTSENSTYFTSSTVQSAGQCGVTVCKCSSDICQVTKATFDPSLYSKLLNELSMCVPKIR